MKAFSFSQSKHWKHPSSQITPISSHNFKDFPFNFHQNPNQFIPISTHKIKTTQNPSLSLTNSSKNPTFPINPPPLLVVGSANADIYVEIDRLPSQGETISAKSGQTLAGGKGANQAVCGGKLLYPTYFFGQIGEDINGKLIRDALLNGGVCLDYVRYVSGVPTGHAIVMLQSDGQNSIIIVGGANMCCWPDVICDDDLEIVKSAGIVLLQREIPDFVNIQVAKAAHNAGVPVILDAGGMDAPLPPELLKFVDIFSPNESELSRLTGMPTSTFDQVSQAVTKCYELGVEQVLVKLGDKGSVLFEKGEEPIKQSIISAPKVLDTTGAGDTFTAAFAVAYVEGKSKQECLRFAAAAASLCVQVKGAIPSMPDRDSVLKLLHSS